jgi:hypothetical protein
MMFCYAFFLCDIPLSFIRLYPLLASCTVFILLIEVLCSSFSFFTAVPVRIAGDWIYKNKIGDIKVDNHKKAIEKPNQAYG